MHILTIVLQEELMSLLPWGLRALTFFAAVVFNDYNIM